MLKLITESIKETLKENKLFLLTGLVAFVLTQVISSPYDFLVAGLWLGFWGGIVFKTHNKQVKL